MTPPFLAREGRPWWPDDRGAVTAEFAVALPAILVVLVLAVGALGAASTAVRLQHASADAARLLGRGDDDGRALGAVATAGGTASIERHDGLVCVVATAPTTLPLPVPPITVRSCAWDGGR